MDKPRYVDPNSGAAPQPGGVAGVLGGERGHAVMAAVEEDSSKEQIVSPDGLSVYPNEPQAPSYEVHDVSTSNDLTEAERVEAKEVEVGGALDGSFVGSKEDPAPGVGADGVERSDDERAALKAQEVGGTTLSPQGPLQNVEGGQLYEEVDAGAESTYDPSEHTVEEVNDYLEENPDLREAVVKAERAGRARKGITGDE